MVVERGTINVLIGSGIVLIGQLINNGFQVWKERFQWHKQQELERQRWERDKLLEIYTNCISKITAYLRSGRSVPPDPMLPAPATPFGSNAIAYNLELHGQAEAWLTLLLIYHPARQSAQYREFEAQVKSLDQTPTELGQLLDKVVALARTDARLLTAAGR